MSHNPNVQLRYNYYWAAICCVWKGIYFLTSSGVYVNRVFPPSSQCAKSQPLATESSARTEWVPWRLRIFLNLICWVFKPCFLPPFLPRARNLSPRQQEALYELKASRMGALKSQIQALRREITLQEKTTQMMDNRVASNQQPEALKVIHELEAKLRHSQLPF